MIAIVKVYLVKEYGGEWEDKYVTLISAHFDKTIAEEKVANLEKVLQTNKAKLELLENLYYKCDCLGDSENYCEKCKEYHVVYLEIENINGYGIEEIEVD